MPDIEIDSYHHPDYSSEKHKLDYLAIVAHQDDAEIIGFSGIHQCYQKNSRWFGAITLTNGAGASRGGRYQEYSNSKLASVRNQEQKKAAQIGEYGVCQQWQCSSSEIKSLPDYAVLELAATLLELQPTVIFTHSPFDRHATHLSVTKLVIKAIQKARLSNKEYCPKLLGVEVWGSLDWLPDHYQVLLDCSPMPHLEQALIGLFDSQIDGNKNYDKAVLGRRLANATFSDSHKSDDFRAVNLAIELTGVIKGRSSLEDFMTEVLNEFCQEKLGNL